MKESSFVAIHTIMMFVVKENEKTYSNNTYFPPA